MNGLLSVLYSWVKPTPLPDITTVEAEFVGGPHDGAMCQYYCVGVVREGEVRTIHGRRYRLERSRGRRVWRLQ